MVKRISEIKRNLENKSTKELRQILNYQNKEEWTQEAFIAIEEILRDRNQLLTDEITCSNCGVNNFEYDDYRKEYTCKDCGNIELAEKKIAKEQVNNDIKQNSMRTQYRYKWSNNAEKVRSRVVRMRGLINGVVLTLISSFFLL